MTTYLTRPEAIEYLGVSAKTFGKYVTRGLVHGYVNAKDHRCRVYSKEQLDTVFDPRPAN